MSGRILIVDTVPTNRIVLKVKMQNAQFSVDACASRIEAEAIIATNRPDLIMINLADAGEDRHEFCAALRDDPQTAAIGIIALGVADTSRARFAALDAGADDVLPRPISDTLLLARIRSLLRVRSTSQELFLRDSTSRALGFEEAKTSFANAANIALLTPNDAVDPALCTILQNGLRLPVRQFTTHSVLKKSAVTPVPDLFVINCGETEQTAASLFGLVSDLRSRIETRQSTVLVVLPQNAPALAAMFLDLGADDVAIRTASADEITLRAKALIRRKLLHDKLRDTVRDGLHAAVTDPLTGLYNRRYVEPHLARMAAQSCNAGRELAVMMLDIDHFKGINDQYGHAAGDRVLVQLAQRLQNNLRAIDLVARMGGEEFLVAMPRTTTAQARGAADRLRQLVNDHPFDLGPDLPEVRVSVSVGVAVSGHNGIEPFNLEVICSRADTALYAAKSAGRNQVAMSRTAA
ncbi:diguanylate cyclase [Loktanella agnita]|uniref:diguanylate cyclase n=1 Tax=Loktanella agnita TaxID=287097 RepID=UPI0039888C8D